MPHDQPHDDSRPSSKLDLNTDATDAWPLSEHLPLLTILHATLGTPEGEAWLDWRPAPSSSEMKA